MILSREASAGSLLTDFSHQPDIASNASFDGREVTLPREDSGTGHSLMSQKSYGSLDSFELPDEIIRVEGLRHADSVLNAKRYKTKAFMDRLFNILQDLQVPTWSEKIYPSNASISSASTFAYDVSPPTKDKVWIHKVSGSLTNAVFFLTVVAGTPEEEKAKPNPVFQSQAPYRTLLLRIYGASSSSLINRTAELRILHILSSRYRIGPRVYGTFGNGRIEEYFESQPLTALEMRDPQVSRWIAIRMSELHRVDLRKVVDPVEWADPADGTRGELGVKRNMRNWLPPAKEVIGLIRNEKYKKEVDIELFAEQWDAYYKWVRDWEKEEECVKESPRVFCHNDTQYGNLLRLKDVKPTMLPHQQIIVVDFEYASPNSAAFDIANQFCEWTSNYLGANSSVMDPKQYPSRSERDNFYLAYLQSGLLLDGNSTSITRGRNSISSSFTEAPTKTDRSTPTATTPTDPSTPTDTPSTNGPNIVSTPQSFTDSPPTTPSLNRETSFPLPKTRPTHVNEPTPKPTKATTPSTPPLAQFTRINQNANTLPEAMDLLEEQVRRWMPASHGLWAVWGLVQAKENVLRDNKRADEGRRSDADAEEEEVTDFDYLQYASGRIKIFRDACKEMGVF